MVVVTNQPSATSPVPPDAVLVHIGMHKTGTTAIQSLLAQQRPELQRLGVCYPGTQEAHHNAARALLRRPAGWRTAGGRPAPPPRVWDTLAEQVHGTRSRVVVSSEFLSRAGAADAQRVVDDLGSERVHVLLGVRNFARIAVSSWQQSLKAGGQLNLERWLRRNFHDETRPPRGAQTFWDRQNPASTLARWIAAAGADRVVVVIIDEHDRTLLPSTFEHLLSLPSGMLTSQEPAMKNRGMSSTEAELVRQVNATLCRQLSWPQYASLIRNGMIRRLIETRSPNHDEARPALPAWALRHAGEQGHRLATQITESGVRVVGDLRSLTEEDTHAGDRSSLPAAVTSVPLDAAVEAVVGTVAGATRRSWSLDAEPSLNAVPVDQVPTRTLASLLTSRAAAAARRHIRARLARLRSVP